MENYTYLDSFYDSFRSEDVTYLFFIKQGQFIIFFFANVESYADPAFVFYTEITLQTSLYAKYRYE